MPTYTAMPTDHARAFQNGASDAYGNPPEKAVSDGHGNPCRHCLKHIPAGKDMLILAYRPFPGLHAYAETGPVFLCADPCERGGGPDLPDILASSPDYLVKGYDHKDRIVYGTGCIAPADRIQARAKGIFKDDRVAYIHVRSARNNCYQARIDRVGEDSENGA